MSVRGEVAAGAQRRNQITHRLQVPWGRFRNCDRSLLQPGIDHVEGSFDAERLLERVLILWSTGEMPSKTIQGNPTVSVPETAASSHDFALAWSGESWLTA